jgi:GH25 family lysozyme M1 (1,4-beta-N-acetylmuramidase)
MTAAYREPFEEPDATPRYRAGGRPLHVEGVENLFTKKKATKAKKKKEVVTRPFRVLTADVRSDPEDSLSFDEVLEDLQRNAAAGDLVFLQGIDRRFRPLVKQAFPRTEWDVFFGKDSNREPIAYRKSLFAMVAGQVTVLHAPRPGLTERRFLTCVRLRFKPLDAQFHAANLHLLEGAFGKKDVPCREGRRAVWTAGVVKHRELVQDLLDTGLPVIGAGVYHRTLRQFKPLGTELAGKQVTYAVEKDAGDLLWLLDGDRTRVHLRSTDEFPGRRSRRPERNSDRDARQAVLVLRPVKAPRPRPADVTGSPEHKGHATKRPRKKSPQQRPAPAVDERYRRHGPFELTSFGDTTKEVVDWKTRAALEEAERRLGYTLTVTQGSYNNGRVPASGPTHDRGGVVDLRALDWKRKVRVLRSIGFAAWHRTPDQGPWPEHIHAVLIDHGRLDPSAARQVESYRRGRNGLKNDAPDPSWRPDPIPVFHYPPRTAAPEGAPGSREHGTDGPPVPAGGSPFPPSRTLDGVDVSHYQRRIDIPRGQAAGVRFMYAKTTEGDGWKDGTYRAKMLQARRAGIPFGSYHFARPDLGDAAVEAKHFLKHADIRAGDMVPMLDLESTEGLGPADLTRWVGRWVATVERELARKGLVCKPIIYTRFPLGDTFGCMLWVARYSTALLAPVIPKPWARAAIWQHSDGVFGPVKSVPGFGPVDVNALHPDVPLSALRIRSATATASRPSTGATTTGSRRPRLRTVNPPSRGRRKYKSARKTHHER